MDDMREGEGIFYDGNGYALKGTWVKDLMHGIFQRSLNGQADGVENWDYGKKK